MANVLIVDDSATDRRLAGGILGKNPGLTLSYAADGREALALIEVSRPDVVVTDLQMPELDGLQLVEQMQSKYPQTPVVLMTAAGSEEIAVKALQAGAASYVPKCKLSQELPDIIARLLAAAERERHYSAVMARMVFNDCRFVLENDLTLIAALSRYLREMLRGANLPNDSDHLRVGVALEEALINAYYHGNLELSSKIRETDHREFYRVADERKSQFPYNQRCVTVDARFNLNVLTFTIRDEGPGFNPAELPDPSDPQYLERPCGRGVMLMRTFMDEVTYNETGNEVTLVKRLTRDSAGG